MDSIGPANAIPVTTSLRSRIIPVEENIALSVVTPLVRRINTITIAPALLCVIQGNIRIPLELLAVRTVLRIKSDADRA